jgi:hypothetical protein
LLLSALEKAGRKKERVQGVVERKKEERVQGK